MPRIELKNLSRSYGDQKVINDLSLSMADGETLILFGSSGSGKSVLLRLIAGVAEIDSGHIFFDGKEVTEVSPEHRGVGMAIQNFALLPHKTARENIASPLIARRRPKAEIEAAVQDVAGLLQIGHVLSHIPSQLSNGQKQRTALARALVAKPLLLLLDDPLRNVDAKLRFEMRLELPRLLRRSGATIIYVTQDYKEAMALGDRIAVMEGGRIRQFGTPEEIYTRPATTGIAKLFGDPAMNFLRARLRPQASAVELAGISFPVPGLATGTPERDCTIGIRPETLKLSRDPSPRAIRVEVETELSYNEVAVTLVKLASGEEVLISRPFGTEGLTEGEAYLGIDPADILLFDSATGDLISAAPEAAQQKGAVA